MSNNSQGSDGNHAEDKLFKKHDKMFNKFKSGETKRQKDKKDSVLSPAQQKMYEMYLKHKFEAEIEIRKYEIDSKLKQQKKPQTRHKLDQDQSQKILELMQQYPKYTASQIKNEINSLCSVQKIQKFMNEHKGEIPAKKKSNKGRKSKRDS